MGGLEAIEEVLKRRGRSGLHLLAAGGLEFVEFGAGLAPGALDGGYIADDFVVLFGGLGIEDDGEVAEFIDDLVFDAAGAAEAPPVLSDFVDEHGFALVAGFVLGDERGAEGVVLGGVLAFDDDLFTGETVTDRIKF